MIAYPSCWCLTQLEVAKEKGPSTISRGTCILQCLLTTLFSVFASGMNKVSFYKAIQTNNICFKYIYIHQN